jgi:hypothetical protein
MHPVIFTYTVKFKFTKIHFYALTIYILFTVDYIRLTQKSVSRIFISSNPPPVLVQDSNLIHMCWIYSFLNITDY